MEERRESNRVASCLCNFRDLEACGVESQIISRRRRVALYVTFSSAQAQTASLALRWEGVLISAILSQSLKAPNTAQQAVMRPSSLLIPLMDCAVVVLAERYQIFLSCKKAQ